MSLLRTTTQKLLITRRRVVPASVKRLVSRVSPLSYFYNEPIGQVFLADDEFETYLCANNFFTTLVPEAPTDAQVDFALHDARGRVAVRRTYRLAPAGSVAVPVANVLREANLRIPVGLAAGSIRPAQRLNGSTPLFKQMGRISSHFFTYYLHRRTQAMAIIHPQCPINQTKPWGRSNWRSGQSVVREGLREVRLYQANHSRSDAFVEYELFDAAHTDRVVARTSLNVPGLAASVSTFDMDALMDPPPVLGLRAKNLPAENNKPLIMRVYGEGRFSMNHS